MNGVRESSSKTHRAPVSVHMWNLILVCGTRGAAYVLNEMDTVLCQVFRCDLWKF